MDREPTDLELSRTRLPVDHRRLQQLVEEARKIGGVVTVQDSLLRERRKCCGLCSICLYSDDCRTFSRNLLGSRDFIGGVVIA